MDIDLPLLVPSQKPLLFKARWPVELVPSMPAVNYDATHPRAFTRLAHVLVPDCQAGDILDCDGTIQISNALGELVEYAAALVATPQASGTAGIADANGALFNTSSELIEPPFGRWVTRFPGYNVTPNGGGMHHAPLSRRGRFLVPQALTGDIYIAFIGYAGGQTFDSNRKVTVDRCCGDLSVMRFR